MRLDKDALARLLPAIYRLRDAQQAEGKRPLSDLIRLLAEQVQELEENLEQLYDDQFIETCDDWIVPYIGDLVGCRNLNPKIPGIPGRRAEVANTIAYRRRKGTASMLEQLARDVTGWESRVVEFFLRLATTQNVNHVRPDNLAVASIKRAAEIESLSTPFESFAHLADIRSVSARRGKYSIPNIGIFVWRLDPFSVTLSPATPVDGKRFFFSQLGHNLPLITCPQSEQDIAHLAEPVNVPMPIGRRLLKEHFADYYGRDRSIFIEGCDKIKICNLSDRGNANNWGPEPDADCVAIDPELGRLMFGADQAKPPEVAFHYGFSAEMGGGEYERQSSFTPDGNFTVIRVPQDHPSVQAALAAIGNQDAIIEITENGCYSEDLNKNFIANRRVEIRSANQIRAHLKLNNPFRIAGDNIGITLNGLLISGNKIQFSGKTKSLRLLHCTLVPGLSLTAEGRPANPAAISLEIESIEELHVEKTILGSIRVNEDANLQLADSILDAASWNAVALAGHVNEGPAGNVSITRGTVIGGIRAAFLKLGCNSIFCSKVTSKKLQDGCVRFSYIPWGSRVPRRHRCQPVDEETAAGIYPVFTSHHFGQPGYCQLAPSTPIEIKEGADDGSEMGAFHDLFQPQRESNLRVRLEEYLRFGLEAGIFYAS
ncbi:MAG: hypothetical protein JXA73_18070 [Acidobacteria bacterium]|nr:hypothetical protein [Acidobacteriota bacterium]